jgi:hypothetical protein
MKSTPCANLSRAFGRVDAREEALDLPCHRPISIG